MRIQTYTNVWLNSITKKMIFQTIIFLSFKKKNDRYDLIDYNGKKMKVGLNPDDLIICYAETNKRRSTNIRDPRTKLITFDGVTMRIVQEPVGHILNIKTCKAYIKKSLHLDKSVSPELILYIFSVVIEKANTVEQWDDQICNIYLDTSGEKENRNSFLTISNDSKIYGLLIMLSRELCRIWISDNEYVYLHNVVNRFVLYLLLIYIHQKSNSKKLLKELFNFWRFQACYRSIFYILNSQLRLPLDLSNLILCMAARDYTFSR